jgi:rubredoxin
MRYKCPTFGCPGTLNYVANYWHCPVCGEKVRNKCVPDCELQLTL